MGGERAGQSEWSRVEQSRAGMQEGTGESKPVAEGREKEQLSAVEHGITRSENHRGTGQLDHWTTLLQESHLSFLLFKAVVRMK